MKSNRIILISSAVILICLGLIAGATFALFTETDKTTVHLQAGNLDVQFYRDSYSYTVLDTATGKLVTKTGGNRVDFTGNTEENFFGIPASDTEPFKVVPGSVFSADMQLVNNGTTAFSYDIDIVYNKNNENFASQITVTVGEYNEDGSRKIIKSAPLNSTDWSTKEGDLEGNLDISAEGKLGKNLFVEVKFEAVGDHNDLMGEGVYFDLVMTCTQSTN